MAAAAPVISDQMRRDGVAIPEHIQKQPTLQANLVCYLDAFYDLDTERSHAQGLTRIPWSAIMRYGEFYSYHDLDELLFFIRRMDDALLEQMATKGGTSGGSDGTVQVVQRAPRPD